MNPKPVAHDMLQYITNPEIRQTYANILNGRIVAQVRCNSATCKGRVIAHISADENGELGVAHEVLPLEPTQAQIRKFEKEGHTPPTYVSGLEGDRVRLDGSRGFRCYCGNNSILHKHEVGHVRANSPTKRDLEQVFGKMHSQPIKYKEVNGKMDVDGFTIERISG
jgi:hypothetical protein